MSGLTYKSIRQKGWVWRNGPQEIEYESGFSLTDGMPFCYEIGTWIPVRPASSREEVVEGQKNHLRNSIAQHEQAIEALTGQLREIERRYD